LGIDLSAIDAQAKYGCGCFIIEVAPESAWCMYDTGLPADGFWGFAQDYPV